VHGTHGRTRRLGGRSDGSEKETGGSPRVEEGKGVAPKIPTKSHPPRRKGGGISAKGRERAQDGLKRMHGGGNCLGAGKETSSVREDAREICYLIRWWHGTHAMGTNKSKET